MARKIAAISGTSANSSRPMYPAVAWCRSAMKVATVTAVSAITIVARRHRTSPYTRARLNQIR